MWFDKREKYMVMVPVEKSNYFIASTTYIDEFTLPMTNLQTRASQLTTTATRTVMIVLAVTAVLIALIVIAYSYRLSGRLKSLADTADRISLGNIDAEMKEIKSKDEIQDLADAFSRMQTSIRLAIKRLKNRE
jgi:HAMP domain-containing protein